MTEDKDFIPAVQHTHEFYIVAPNNERVSTADIQWRNGACWLTNVWTHHEYRHRRFADRLVRRALTEYPAIDVYLMVHPYTDHPMNEYHLIDWYAKFGFTLIPDAPGIMVRKAVTQDVA